MKWINYYTVHEAETGELYSYYGRTRFYEHELDEVLDWAYGGKDIITRSKENLTIVKHQGYGF